MNDFGRNKECMQNAVGCPECDDDTEIVTGNVLLWDYGDEYVPESGICRSCSREFYFWRCSFSKIIYMECSEFKDRERRGIPNDLLFAMITAFRVNPSYDNPSL